MKHFCSSPQNKLINQTQTIQLHNSFPHPSMVCRFPFSLSSTTFALIVRFFSSSQSAIRLNENATKINQLKDDQEECETRLEKERDIYASNMFDLLAEEDNISSYILNYVKCKHAALISLFAKNLRAFAFPFPFSQINNFSTSQRSRKLRAS